MPSSPPSSIRAAQAADRAAIIAIASASGLFPAQEMAEIAAILDAFLTGAAGDDRWIVDDTGVGAVGVAYYAPERMTDGTWNLYLLAVHPDHQGTGRGAGLVRHVEQDLERAGARVLLVETSGVPEFAAQRAFYASLGYRDEARIREFYGPGDDKIVFWKHLDPVVALRRSPQHHLPHPADPGLRVARVDDVAALQRLAEDFYREDGFTTGPDVLEANLHSLVRSDAARVVLVVDHGQAPVGFAVTTTSFGLENGLIAELEDLYVQPAGRRRGLAARLIDDAATWARARGCARIEVVIAPNGHDVSRLHGYYQARGFLDDGRHLRSRDLS